MRAAAAVLDPGAPARECSPNQQDDDGAEDRENPRPQVKEVAEPAAEDQGSDPAPEQGPDDADDQRDQPSPGLLAREDQFCDGAGDKTQQEKCEKTHKDTPSFRDGTDAGIC